MNRQTCSVPGCAAPVLARGYCTSHYRRWRRYGDPTAGSAVRRGTARRRVCEIPGCGRQHHARGMCVAHWWRWCRGGEANPDQPISRTRDSYWAVHQRLKTDRGPASARRCADCGAPARDWSYDHTDPAERTDPVRGYRYSLDQTRYVPRCRRCHRRATIAARGGSGLDVERAARLYRAGATARGIGAVLGVSPNIVLRCLRAHGVPIRRGGRRPRQRFGRPDQGASTDRHAIHPEHSSTDQRQTTSTTHDHDQN